MQNQVNLPFNPFALQFQPMMFTQDAPPVLPNLTDLNPKIAYILPNVCSEILNEVTNKSGANNLRIFHFNQIYTNNFNNQDFFQLVQSTMDMIELALVNQTAHSPEHAMQIVIPNSVLFSCVLNLQNPQYRQSLASVSDQRVIYEAEKYYPQIASVQNAILNYKQSAYNTMQSPAFINHSGGRLQNQQWNQQPTQQQYGNPPMGNSYNARFPSAAAPVNNQQYQTQKTYTQKPFQPVQQNQYQQQQPMNPDSKYSYLEKARDVQVSVVPKYQQPVQQVQSTPVEIIEVKDNDGYDEKTKWIPSEEFPYPVAVNKKQKLRSKTSIRTKTLIDGTVKNILINELIVQPRSKEDMDREQHTLVTSAEMAITSFIPTAFTTREEAVNNALTNVASQANKESPKLSDKVKTNEKWQAHMFLDRHIFENKVAHVARTTDDECSAYRSYHVLTKPFVSKRDNGDVLQHLSKSTSIYELIKRMQDAVVGNTDKHVVQFIYEVDRYLTDEFSKYLSGKFCIYIKKLDSFMDDCGSIYDFILQNSTEAHLQAFKENEHNFIKSFVNSIQSEDVEQISKEGSNIYAADEETVLANVTFIENAYSITSIDIHSTEINIELYKETEDEGKGRSSLIKQSNNPLLFKFAKDLITETIEVGFNFAHHLVITSDGVIYEIHKGLIGFQENYLISEFPV